MLFRRTLTLLLVPAALTALTAGCEDSKPKSSAKKPGSIINEKTQEVFPLDQALQKEPGARVAATDISSSDYLGQLGEAYKTSVAKIAAMSIMQAIQLRNASSIADPKPLTYDEFMSEILKKGQPDGIMLPKLPPYMVYAWDEANQQLVAVEYPETKKRIIDEMPGPG
jgi:hypothetical protein